MLEYLSFCSKNKVCVGVSLVPHNMYHYVPQKSIARVELQRSLLYNAHMDIKRKKLVILLLCLLVFVVGSYFYSLYTRFGITPWQYVRLFALVLYKSL